MRTNTITQQEWSEQMLHKVHVAHKWGTHELGPLCLSEQETHPWAGPQPDHPTADSMRASLASWLGTDMLTSVDKRESIKGVTVFGTFLECLPNVILNNASKIIHELLEFPAPGGIQGKKVDLASHIAKNDETLLKFKKITSEKNRPYGSGIRKAQLFKRKLKFI